MPSTMIAPELGSSSRFRQRSSVDLPEPDGPMTNTSSRSATVEIDALQDMQRAEMLVDAARFQDGTAHGWLIAKFFPAACGRCWGEGAETRDEDA